MLPRVVCTSRLASCAMAPVHNVIAEKRIESVTENRFQPGVWKK